MLFLYVFVAFVAAAVVVLFFVAVVVVVVVAWVPWCLGALVLSTNSY